MFDQMAKEDFDRALTKGMLSRVLAFLRGKSRDLLPFDEVRQRLPIQGQRYIGNIIVPIKNIVGSQGRYLDFDRAFLPLQSRTKERWASIDRAHLEQVELPPVELYKIGDIYFVKDGNHRVSVARERGQEFIDAHVIEIIVPVSLTVDTQVDDLELKEKQARFLDQTGLHRSRPDGPYETRVLETYDELMEHIRTHRWYLGEKLGRQPTLEEASVSWYDQVYAPLVRAIQAQGLDRTLSNVDEPDLYLWIAKYQWYLRIPHTHMDQENVLASNDAASLESSATAAAKDHAAMHLTREEDNSPAVRRLASVLRKASWVEEFVLEQDRAGFLAHTNLLVLHPDADIRVTTPGQYQRLLEHIDVHRWYLGVERNSEVPYADAVTSWYDNVYFPLVQLIREQKLLSYFPGRTEADLYLWFINRQAVLKEAYSEQEPPKLMESDP
jgi:hypothetical protein